MGHDFGDVVDLFWFGGQFPVFARRIQPRFAAMDAVRGTLFRGGVGVEGRFFGANVVAIWGFGLVVEHTGVTVFAYLIIFVLPKMNVHNATPLLPHAGRCSQSCK